MLRGFCPKCGDFSFAYNYEAKTWKCYNIACEFVDTKHEHGEGLSENPFSTNTNIIENKK